MIRGSHASLILLVATVLVLGAAEPFPGEKTDFQGAVRYNVQVGDRQVTVLSPDKSVSNLRWVLAPALAETGDPLHGNLTRAELELVKRGFHVVAIDLEHTVGDQDSLTACDLVYQAMTTTYGLNKQIAMVGVGGGGLTALRWAAANPKRVSCIYLDKAACDFKSWPGGKLGIGKGSPDDWSRLMAAYRFASEAEALAYDQNPVDLAAKLAAARIAILCNMGEKDEVVPYAENGARIEQQYAKLGGVFTVIRHADEGHAPYGLSDPGPIVDFIEYRSFTNPEPTHRVVSYGTHRKQFLDFWQAPADAPTPLAIYIHGGGWNGGTRLDAGHVEDLLKAGISVAAVEYRFLIEARADGLKPPVKGPMDDVARAVQFLRSHASDWNIRKDRIAAWGGSAGGCSSLWLAFHKDLADPGSADPIARESTRLSCVAAMIPQTSLDPLQMKEWIPNTTYGALAFGFGSRPADKMSPFDVFLEKRETVLPWIAEYSPYALATSDAPPVYLWFGTVPDLGKPQNDPTHSANFGVKLQERLRDLKVECELVYPGAPRVRHPQVHEYLIDRLRAP